MEFFRVFRLGFLASTVLLFIILTDSSSKYYGVRGEEGADVNMFTIPERVALKKFRLANAGLLKRLSNKMNYDEYFIKWLRSNNLDVESATAAFLKNLEWRKQNNMDHILEEKFPLFDKSYPTLFVTDRKGRPVLLLPVGAWDIRKAVLSGHGPELERFLKQLFERCFQKATDAFHNNPHRNVTEMSVILDLAGYNTRQHACAGCIPIYINLILNYERFYPQGAHRLIGINTPPIFNALLEILKPFMSEHTRKSQTFLGFDKEIWRKEIVGEIAPEELPPQYGGTKKVEIH